MPFEEAKEEVVHCKRCREEVRKARNEVRKLREALISARVDLEYYCQGSDASKPADDKTNLPWTYPNHDVALHGIEAINSALDNPFLEGTKNAGK